MSLVSQGFSLFALVFPDSQWLLAPMLSKEMLQYLLEKLILSKSVDFEKVQSFEVNV